MKRSRESEREREVEIQKQKKKIIERQQKFFNLQQSKNWIEKKKKNTCTLIGDSLYFI